MKNIFIVQIALTALLLSACNVTINNFKISPGSGRISSEIRQVLNFNKVEINGVGELFITQGKQESLRIEAEDNVLDMIISDVSDGTLNIGFKERNLDRFVLPYRAPKYYLEVINLSDIQVDGALRVDINNLKTDNLDLKLNGAGDIEIDELYAQSINVVLNGGGRQKFSGKVSEQTVVVNGVGQYDAADLESVKATVKLYGAGEATVWAKETLDATMDGAGSIRYYGDPTGERTINGVGTISSIGVR